MPFPGKPCFSDLKLQNRYHYKSIAFYHVDSKNHLQIKQQNYQKDNIGYKIIKFNILCHYRLIACNVSKHETGT